MAQCMSPLPFPSSMTREDGGLAEAWQAWDQARSTVAKLYLSEASACCELERRSGRATGRLVDAGALTEAIDDHIAVTWQLHRAAAEEQLAAARVRALLRHAVDQTEREAIEDAAYWQAIEAAEETDATDRAEYLRAIGATL